MHCFSFSEIFFVGMKSDLVREEKRERVVSDASTYCTLNGLTFWEASAKDGQNVDKIFLQLARSLLSFDHALSCSPPPPFSSSLSSSSFLSSSPSLPPTDPIKDEVHFRMKEHQNHLLESLNNPSFHHTSHIEMSECQLTKLPEFLWRFKFVRSANFSDNLISFIPRVVVFWKYLEYLDLGGNPLFPCAERALAGGLQLAKDYFHPGFPSFLLFPPLFLLLLLIFFLSRLQ